MRFKWFINKLKNSAKWLRNKIKKSPLYWRTMLIIFLIAFILKIFVIYLSYKHLDPIKSCLSYISSDIIILFLSQLLVTVNSRIKIRWWRLLNDVIVFILLIIYCVDIFVIFFFQSRVSISEAFALWSNGSVGFAWAVRNRIIIFLIIWFLSFLLAQTRKIKKKLRMKKNDSSIFCLLNSLCCILYNVIIF